MRASQPPPIHRRPPLTPTAHATGTWDPKITTPPGLYLVGTAVLWAVGKAQALLHGDASPAAAAAICAPGQPILPYLRPINAAFNLGTFLLVYRLMYRTRKVRGRVRLDGRVEGMHRVLCSSVYTCT